MGVTGLWKLIEPCGEAVPVDTLECKILAVDISIWLHQVVKGFQDNKGNALPNAHLLGLFHRLCKLLYYRVKPVFVFDGCVPQLKRDTIARRQQQRSKLNTEADRIQALLMQALAKEKVVQQALGANAAELLLKSPAKLIKRRPCKDDAIDELFKLPDLPPVTANAAAASKDGQQNNDSSFDYSASEYDTTTGTEDSSFDESNGNQYYMANLQAIDVRNEHFKSLPAEMRHDILVDIKESRKQSSWGRLHELPAKSDDFSVFQMKRLLRRRAVQESLEEAEQEMGGRTLTLNELKNIFTEEGIVEPTALDKGSKQIISDENTRFLLIRDLKKKLATLDEHPDEQQQSPSTNADVKKETSKILTDDKPSTSQNNQLKSVTNDALKDESMDKEYAQDLELAIALSLEQSNVYSAQDYDYDSDESLTLNNAQCKELKNAAKGPARAYMIEYGGLNKEEVLGIVAKKSTLQTFDDVGFELTAAERELIMATTCSQHTDDMRLRVTDSEAEDDIEKNANQKRLLPTTDYVAETDSDLEIVPDSQIALPANIAVTKTTAVETKIISDSTDSEMEEVPDSQQDANTNISKFKALKNAATKTVIMSDTDSSTSDMEEVPETPEFIETTKAPLTPVEIVIDAEKLLAPQDDLFADIFEDTPNLADIDKLNKKQLVVEQKMISNNLTDADKLKMQKFTPLKTNMAAVLDELKQQAVAVTKIKLDDIKIDQSIIELSDDDDINKMLVSKKHEITPQKLEIIEILDEESVVRYASKSPKLKTPSKNKIISDFFETNYVVKRTPDKPPTTEEEQLLLPSKVKSPFFVNKTPKSSGRKRGSDSGSNSPSPLHKMSKAAKSLFAGDAPNAKEAEKEEAKKIEEIIEVAPAPVKTAEEVLTEAANLLKEQKSTQELEELATDLAQEQRDLEKERNRQERMGMTINQRMNVECQELLRLFGIPYIVAGGEAEAQCAFLDAMQLTNGTITDDSDIWLFGGRTVYKNFFAQNKNVLEFRADKIEKNFNCDRFKLIQLACLVGSDYTTGIHGIGAVTAMEILATFSNTKKDSLDVAAPTNTPVANIFATLSQFRDWWLASKSKTAPPGSSTRLALLKKLKNIDLCEGFPNITVIDAYLTPKVDENKERFTWGEPDVESIREFTRKSFGWTTSKTDDVLMPVMKRLNEKKTQATIKNYFTVKSTHSVSQLKVSKRVQTAIDKMSGKLDETIEAPTTTKRAKVKRKVPTKKTTNKNVADDKIDVNDDDDVEMLAQAKALEKPKRATRTKRKAPTNDDVAPTAAAANVEISYAASGSSKGPISMKRLMLPETKEIIPQREKDLEKMRKNKEKAAAVLRKTRAAKPKQ